MTRRVGGLWPEVTSFDNLMRAARRAARGKRHQAGVARFLERSEYHALALQTELLEKRYRPDKTTVFRILDPKPREITVASFRDRVVQHALIDVLEPHFDRRLIAHSYACRRGKGTQAALDHAQRSVRRFSWFLKLDIARCFASLRHDVVLETVASIIKDRDVLDLFRVVVCHPGDDAKQRGLPIGYLTSQWLANLVLGRLDQHVQQALRAPGYVRYMDDFVLFSNHKAELRRAHKELKRFLTEELDLTLKDSASMLAPPRAGLPFLGFRLYTHTRRIRPQNRKRTYQRWKQRLWEFHHGLIDEGALANSTRSLMAHLEAGTTRGLRRRWCKMFATRDPPFDVRGP